MITTEEAKRIAKILFDGGVKTSSARIENIVNQIKLLPDAIYVDFGSVREYVAELYNEYNRMQDKFHDVLTKK